MSIWIEDGIRDAILAVRWKRAGDSLDPGYFVNAQSESLQLEGSAASFLARFIADRVITGQGKDENDSVAKVLDRYSPEVIASYLEDQGYTVSSPD